RRTTLPIRPPTSLALAAVLAIAFPLPSHSQAKPAQPARKSPMGPPAPQSTHYPILLLGFGNDPSWSLRIGLKGPERLDRPVYPPMALEPAEVTHESGVESWIYRAKDIATGTAIIVHLTREPCTDPVTDPTAASRPANGKYTFRISIEH